MARPLRIQYSGAIYHVTSRMVGSWRERRERLFWDERNYERFLERLRERVQEFGIRLYLFCLMSDEYLSGNGLRDFGPKPLANGKARRMFRFGA